MIKIEPENSASSRRKFLFSALALLTIITLIYINTFDASWHFDDEPNITENPLLHLTELTWDNIRNTFFSLQGSPHSLYRPLACLSLALNYYFGGTNVFGYHLVNTAVHFTASLFLFLFTYQTLMLPRFGGIYRSKAYLVALLSTALWAANPVQTQAVTYIVQRMASMAGMFYIISMYAYVKARTCHSVRGGYLYFSLAAISALSAFGCKQNAIMVPMSLLIYEFMVIQNSDRWLTRKNIILFSAISLSLLAGGLVFQYLFHGSSLGIADAYAGRPFDITQRLLTQPRVIIFYLSLIFYPISTRLNLAHWTQISNSLFDPPTTIMAILAIGILIAVAFRLAGKHPLVSFSILFFFLNHLIESSFFPLELVYEHRNYIPSMLLFLPFALLFSMLHDRYSNRRGMRFILVSFGILLIAGFGLSTFLRNDTWKNDGTLWGDALSKAPLLHRNYHNLGKFYHEAGFYRKALYLYKKSLEQKPHYMKGEKGLTYYNLGKLHYDLGNNKEAITWYQKAIEASPNHIATFINLAGIMDQSGKEDLAFKYLARVIALDRFNPEANFNMGVHYLKKNEIDKALYHFRLTERHLQIPLLDFYLGIAYKHKGIFGKSYIYLKRALRENPSDYKPYLHLAESLQRAGHKDKAKEELMIFLGKIEGKGLFSMVLANLRNTGNPSGVAPDADILLPLMDEVCREKVTLLQGWQDAISGMSEGYSKTAGEIE